MHYDTSIPGQQRTGDIMDGLPDAGSHRLEDVHVAQPAVPLADNRSIAIPEAPPLSFGKSLTYSSGNFGSGIWFAFNNFILPLFLQPLRVPPVIIGLLASSRSFEGAFVQPVVGAWSDRIWSTRLGRRRAFIARFVPISALFVVLTAFFPGWASVGPLAQVQHALNLSHNRLVVALVFFGIFVFTLAFNIMYDPYQALLADITPEAQRGRVNGVYQALGAFGQTAILLVGAFLGLSIEMLFVLCGVSLFLFFIPTVFGIKEPRELPSIGKKHRYTVRDYWNGVRGDPQVLLYFLNQAFMWFGINAITPYLTLYAINEVHFNSSQALYLDFVLLLCSAVFVWPFGLLGDRIGLKRVFLIGMVCMAGAAVAGVFTHDIVPLFVVVAIAGIGNAAQTSSSFPLLTQLVPGDQMGLYTGLVSSVTSIAAPASTALAGLLIGAFTYSAMFPIVAAMFLLSLIPLGLLRVERSVVQRAKRAAAAGEAALTAG